MGNEWVTWVKTHRLLVAMLMGVAVLGLGLIGLVAVLRPPMTATPLGTAAMSSQVTKSRSTKTAPSSRLKESTSGPLYVDVKGAVQQPGLYQVTAKMRVADAIALAKGLTPQADQRQVNLAAKVVDQQVIYVPTKGEKAPALASPTTPTSRVNKTTDASGKAVKGTSAGANKDKINLNTADVAALQKLSGVGQKKAEKIIAFRDQHGDFKSVADLKKVGGFGDKTLAKFRDQLTV